MNKDPAKSEGPLSAGTVSLGIVFIAVSSMVFAPLSQTATKFLAGDFPIFQILFFRSLGQTVWMVLFFWPKYRTSMFQSSRPWIQLSRSALLFVSMLLWISAIAAVPLATASAINFTAPIMVVLLSIPFLGERVGLHRWGAVLVGFVGALVIIQPGSGEVPPEVLYLLCSAALFAFYQILTRKMATTDNAAVTSVYTVVVALVVSSVVMPFDYKSPEPGDWIVWLAFLAGGLLGGIRHFFVVKAYELAPASVVSPFFYCELLGVTALGFFVFGDFPDSTAWLGAGIIVCSGLYIAHRERVRAKT